MLEDKEVLRLFGIRVPDSQVEETMKLVCSTQSQKEEIQKLRAIKKDPNDEDNFLKGVLSYYKDDKETANSKVVFKDGTYLIRAVDPEDIQSITERAYFNSFNLQRNKTSELATSDLQADSGNPNQDLPKNPNVKSTQSPKVKQGDDVSHYCYCGKQKIVAQWVKCDNEQNCKGKVWYHYQCVGLRAQDNVQGQTFICEFCKGPEQGLQPEKQKLRKM